MSDDVDTRLAAVAEELGKGNVDVLSGFLSARFFTYAPDPDEPTAVERITALVSDVQAAMPDLSVSLTDIERSGDGFTATMTATGTSQNALWGAPATGTDVTWTNPITIKPIGETFAVRFDDVALPNLIGLFRTLGFVNEPDAMDQAPKYPITIPEFLLKLIFTGQAGDKPCDHLDLIRVVEPSTRACAACVAVGDYWPALRMCLVCGEVGCCDTSKNKHMNQHYQETGHPVMRSIRMDEGWVWCYEDSAFFEKSILDRYR